MRKLLSLIVLLAFLTGCTNGYSLVSKAKEKVKTSVQDCTKKICNESATTIQEATKVVQEFSETSEPDAPVQSTNAGRWDTKMLLW
ncbi:lipoprotein [Foetidibacter luteolus]|uniref:lipoprotein n=1 Tax=Foetidibacter luteolus TaxID=2608880 RepID=UPI00129B053B|nr:lipoprotein [Foetidibacter luteolus]